MPQKSMRRLRIPVAGYRSRCVSGAHGAAVSRMEDLSDPIYVAAVAGYFSAIRERDEKRWLEAFEPDAVCHDPVGSVPVDGREGLREVWKVLTAPFKALSMRESDAYYGGAGAAVHWKAEGTGVNERTVRFSGITVFEFSVNGKIQAVMSYWDPAAMLIDLAGETDESSPPGDPSLRN